MRVLTLAAVAIALVACDRSAGRSEDGAGAGVPETPIANGRYATDSLAAMDAGRSATLELKGGGRATLSTTAGGGTTSVDGEWSAAGPNLTVTLKNGDGSEETMTWRLIQTRLVPVTWDHERYGQAGLTLNPR